MSTQQADRRRSLWSGVVIGSGLMAAVDEIIFHQLLQWHHFFDRATPVLGLLSDGLLHAAELIAIVAGGFLLADLLQRGTLARGCAWAGSLMGAGAFQVFDGLVDHKLLRVHQIRYVDNLLPYDLAWNLSGLLLFLLGLWLWRRVGAAAS